MTVSVIPSDYAPSGASEDKSNGDVLTVLSRVILNCGDVRVLGDAQAENPNWVCIRSPSLHASHSAPLLYVFLYVALRFKFFISGNVNKKAFCYKLCCHSIFCCTKEK